MEEIIIEKVENAVLVCVLENNEIVEKYNFNIKNTSTIGNIYIGTVKDIFDGMQAAFVDVGLSKNAFLSLKDAMPKVNLSKNNKLVDNNLNDNNGDVKISEILKKGQNILLQIRKEAFEEKGPRVSTHITLAGNYMVIMPETDIITISQKIEDYTEKERLLEIVKSNLPESFGCIVRTDACGIDKLKLIEDLNKTLNLWNDIILNFEKICYEKENKDTDSVAMPFNRLLYDDNDIVLKIARDMVRKTTKKIYVNDKEIYEKLKLVVDIQLLDFKENRSFINEFGLEKELEKIDNKKIWLNCGAHIVIDRTEALTAIDVNSSKCIGNEELEKTIFKINKEAAVEVMKQLRLKDIGGIVIIDFIDMHKEEYKDEILKIMREEKKKDRSKIEIKEFTQLNLVEMTRKKMYV